MLTDTTVNHILELQQRYPLKRGALLMAIHAAQEEAGYLTKDIFAEIGDLFNLDPAEVESVASFYTMFYTKPQGKCTFQLCTNVSCMVEGAYAVMEHLRTTLGIKPGEVTEDGLFGLMEVECLAGCDTAPCLQLSDREFIGRVTIEDVDRVIAHFRNGGQHPAPGIEPQPQHYAGEAEVLPLAPLTPEEIKPRPGGQPAAAATPAPKSAPAPSAPPVTGAGLPVPPPEALKAEEEAYARLQAAARARTEASTNADQIESERLVAKERARSEALQAAEEAAAKRLAEIEAKERETFRKSIEVIVVRPPEPEPEPEPEEELIPAPPADLSALESGMRIGGAAPALEPMAGMADAPEIDGAQPPEVCAPAEPEPEPAPPEPLVNLETAADLPAWEPENPYLRLLGGAIPAPAAGPAPPAAPKPAEEEPSDA